MNTRKTGTHFEARAESYLTQQGLTAVARNYRLSNGEIDLIMRDGEFWVFVEVKYRANSLTEHPLGQIRSGQVQRIRRTAKVYLYSHGLNEYLTPCRFDVVAITGEPDELIWLANAF
ncbi:YraN family protein [Aliidiomarina sp. Khilg15.8]